MTNLSNVIDYLGKIIKQRGRQSSHTVRRQSSHTARRQSSHTSLVTDEERKQLTATRNSFVQLPNESERKNKFRIETEIGELQRLLTVIQGMVTAHIQLIDGIKKCWNDDLQTFLIGECISTFLSSIQTPYTTYAVVALSNPHLSLATRGEEEKSEFVKHIVNKYVTSALNSQESEELTEMDWQWYLKRPLIRLSCYPKYLSAFHGESNIKLSSDNKRLRIASMKFECISNSILDALKTR